MYATEISTGAHAEYIAVRQANAPARTWMVSAPAPGAHSWRLPSGLAAYRRIDAGTVELGSLIRADGAPGCVTAEGIAHAARMWPQQLLQLDCFDALTAHYAAHGLDTVERYRFNPHMAPATWTAAYGHPSVHVMVCKLTPAG